MKSQIRQNLQREQVQGVRSVVAKGHDRPKGPQSPAEEAAMGVKAENLEHPSNTGLHPSMDAEKEKKYDRPGME